MAPGAHGVLAAREERVVIQCTVPGEHDNVDNKPPLLLTVANKGKVGRYLRNLRNLPAMGGAGYERVALVAVP